MAPDLVKLYEHRPGDLEIVMISRGTLEDNQRKAKAFGYPFPVLIERSWEISKEYAMFATPIGYLIDADGIIDADVAGGPEPILALVESRTSRRGTTKGSLSGALRTSATALRAPDYLCASVFGVLRAGSLADRALRAVGGAEEPVAESWSQHDEEQTVPVG